MSASRLDSLYVKFLSLRAPELLTVQEKPVELKPEERKCGMELAAIVKFNLSSFSESRQKVLLPLLQRPVLDTSIVSSSGRFRIHFNTSGANVPKYLPQLSALENAQIAAESIDSVYRFEVEYLGYPNAPPDNGNGGDNLYDIYITYQGGGLYGATYFEDEIGSGTNKFTSYMEVDIAYVGYYSSGVDGLQVTLAHEFHHAIQGGNYILRIGGSANDSYFYELTSTAFEDFVYSDVNDYVAYLGSLFSNPDTPMPLHNGYDYAIWNKFLKERFGFDIIKQQWEMMPTLRAITCISNSLISNGSSFPRAMNQFGIWTFYTNFRSIPGVFFDDAALYPIVSLTNSSLVPPSVPVTINSGTIANNFLRFINSSKGDTLYSIISNGDAVTSLQNTTSTMPFTYTLYNSGTSGSRELNSNYSADFEVDQSTYWSVSEILNGIILREDTTIISPSENISYAYPNPFYYSKTYLTGSYIFFPVDFNAGETVDVSIYSTGMFLVRSGKAIISLLPGGKKGIGWDALNDKNEKLPTGVYIYAIKKGNDLITGKIAIFNE